MSKIKYQRVQVGDVFNGVKVIALAHRDTWNNRHLLCLCHCGKEFDTIGFRLKSGHTRSCGCLVSKKCIERNINTDKAELSIRAIKGHQTKRAKNESINC